MTVISLLARSLLVAGVLILVGALVPVRRLIERLPPGTVRNRWYVMVALIALFVVGYLSYAAFFWNNHARLVDLLVPAVFFFGACFVMLTAYLALQTAMDVMRISLLERENVTDPLTGAFNRRYLDRRLAEEVTRARRYDLSLSVLLIDVDHFKLVNDKHGHQMGDQVLSSLARIAAQELRESDILARYGGEEFLVVASHTPLSGATDLAERLRERIARHDFGLPQEPGQTQATNLTASVGVTSIGEGRDSAEKLVQAADENLYRAKREGRNRVVADAAAAPASPPG